MSDVATATFILRHNQLEFVKSLFPAGGVLYTMKKAEAKKDK